MHKRMKLRSDESSESNESDHDLEGKITLTGWETALYVYVS